MIEQILLKNRGAFASIENAERLNRLGRLQFNYMEVPQIGKYQMEHGLAPSGTYKNHPEIRDNAKENISRMRLAYRQGLKNLAARDAKRLAEWLIENYPRRYPEEQKAQLIEQLTQDKLKKIFSGKEKHF